MIKDDILTLLKANDIQYELVNHNPVFTIEDMLNEHLPHSEYIAKNLFVRDDKKKHYYLITLKEDKKLNLKEFQARYNLRKLSFASSDDLMGYLGLTPGSVTPFGLFNDKDNSVIFYLDKDFKDSIIGIHPNTNTATLYLKTSDLLKLIKQETIIF